MDDTLIILGSITTAMRARDALLRRGLRAYVRRAPSDERLGCGYGVLVSGDGQAAESLLRAQGFRVLGVLRGGGGG